MGIPRGVELYKALYIHGAREARKATGPGCSGKGRYKTLPQEKQLMRSPVKAGESNLQAVETRN